MFDFSKRSLSVQPNEIHMSREKWSPVSVYGSRHTFLLLCQRSHAYPWTIVCQVQNVVSNTLPERKCRPLFLHYLVRQWRLFAPCQRWQSRQSLCLSLWKRKVYFVWGQRLLLLLHVQRQQYLGNLLMLCSSLLLFWMGDGAARHRSVLRCAEPCRVMTHNNKFTNPISIFRNTVVSGTCQKKRRPSLNLQDMTMFALVSTFRFYDLVVFKVAMWI